jgi:inward rectifier potassium channel
MNQEEVEKLDHEIDRDLGLGSRVAEQSTVRFLNRDGSFNVRREGFGFFRSRNMYHWLLTMSWPRFHLIVAVYYAVANLLFAAGYLACGPGALHGAEAETLGERFMEAFFFSVQTLATIGYGRLSPEGLAANILVSAEALTGLLGFAMITGLLFSRFARPTAKILYSEHAIIAPYHGRTAFEFRLANERSNQLIDVQATVVLSRLERGPGGVARKFYPLTLEREKVIFLPLHWVIVHPIDEKSPLYGVTEEAFRESDAEFLILLSATDETFSTVVHSRSSYKHHEVIWGASFGDMFQSRPDGVLSIDLRRIHTITKS